VFCGFWASDLEGILRLRSWAALEPGYKQTGYGRDPWQREGLQTLVGRIRERYGTPPEEEVEDVVDVLHVLLGPESYEKLTRTGRKEAEVAALLKRTARAVLGIEDR